MIIDNNFLAYEYYKNQFTPQEVYRSGEKEETKLINKYSEESKELPVIVLEDDIVNEEGYGLKKGFYNVCPDKYLDFLLIYQSGKLKAKIPVVKVEVFESNNPEQMKPEKMSYSKYRKKLEKEYRKYMKGENPEEINWMEANIRQINGQNAWILEYNSNKLRLVGIIKF